MTRGEVGATFAGEGAQQPAHASAGNAGNALFLQMPYSTQDFRDEIRRVKRKRRVIAVLCTIVALLVATAIAVAVAFGIPGSVRVVDTDKLAPSVEKGQVIVLQKTDRPEEGDAVAYRDASGSEHFARVLATEGAWVNIAGDGSIVLSEVSLEGTAPAGVVADGQSIILSRQVPPGACFVLPGEISDPTETLSALEAPVLYEDVVGRIAYRIWPLF